MIHNKKKHICVAVAAVQFLALSKAMCKKLSAQQSNLLSILVLSIAMCKFSAQQSLAEQKAMCNIMMSALACQSYQKNHRNFSKPSDIKKQYKVEAK